MSKPQCTLQFACGNKQKEFIMQIPEITKHLGINERGCRKVAGFLRLGFDPIEYYKNKCLNAK